MFAYCQDMPGATQELISRVEAEVGREPVPGLIAHVAGPSQNGWRIIDVWESEDDHQAFLAARLGPAVGRATAGMPAPPVPFELYQVTGASELCRLGGVLAGGH